VSDKLTTPKGFSYTQRQHLLRLAGCICTTPLHGWRPSKGPRCRLCGVIADIRDTTTPGAGTGSPTGNHNQHTHKENQ
jgi:hypothetical protein